MLRFVNRLWMARFAHFMAKNPVFWPETQPSDFPRPFPGQNQHPWRIAKASLTRISHHGRGEAPVCNRPGGVLRREAGCKPALHLVGVSCVW